MNNFYVLGMPRCRSLWLSYLLSYGDSYCYHEYLSNFNLIRCKQLPPVPRINTIGSSDTLPLNFNEKLVGSSPLVIIDRDLHDTKNAIKNAFGFIGNEPEIDILDVMYEKLQSIDTSNTLRIKFKDLHKTPKLQEIIKFIGLNIPDTHISKLSNARIIADVSSPEINRNQMISNARIYKKLTEV